MALIRHTRTALVHLQHMPMSQQTSKVPIADVPEQHQEALQQAQQAYTQMQSDLYQAISTSLWTYYLFFQTESFAWEQPLLSVHSMFQQAQLVAAAAHIQQQEVCLSEMAAYIHQYSGMHCHPVFQRRTRLHITYKLY